MGTARRLIRFGAELPSRFLARWNRVFEAMKEASVLGIAARLIVCLLAIYSLRCPPDGTPSLEYETAHASGDDGYVWVIADSLPRAVGWVCGGTEDAYVGVVSDTAGRTVVSRVLYLFPPGFDEQESLHLRCRDIVGKPGPIRIYAVPRFDTLPVLPADTARDVSAVWVLPDSGVLVATVSPGEDTWFSVCVSYELLPQFTGAFMLRLDNEDRAPGNAYNMLTWDYARNHGVRAPYYSWWWLPI